MSTNYYRSWIMLLVFVGVMLRLATLAHGFVVSLGGGNPHDPGAVRSGAADVLYATDRDGREVKIVGTDSSLDDGVPLDLGMPSVGPDGTVFFGAAFRHHDRLRWEIFAANPDEHSLSRVVPSAFTSSLEMISDPTPLAQSDGSVVFGAREILRGDGLYRLKDGKLSCLVRVGANLADGHVLRNVGFGSFSAARDGPVAFTGYLTQVGKAELLATDRKVTVLATVGAKAPDGARFRDLGPPTVRDDYVAFPAVTDRGEGVYEFWRGKVRTVLTTGSPCSAGRVTYISQDRVAINSDGTVVLGTTCSRVPSILMVRGSQATMLVTATRTQDESGFVEFGRPSLLDDGTVLFGAGKTDGADGLYSLHASLGSAGIGAVLPLIAASNPMAPPLHSILIVSVAGNEHGRLAYLGGPVVSFASVPQ
jgi:hypothetical protein